MTRNHDRNESHTAGKYNAISSCSVRISTDEIRAAAKLLNTLSSLEKAVEKLQHIRTFFRNNAGKATLPQTCDMKYIKRSTRNVGTQNLEECRAFAWQNGLDNRRFI